MTTTFQTTTGDLLTEFAFSLVLAPGRIVEVTFIGRAETQFGHAIIALCSSDNGCISELYGQVTLQNHNAISPGFEWVFPLEQPSPLQYMLFDHRNGIKHVLYAVNENRTDTTFALDFYNTANRSIQSVALSTLASLDSTIGTLHELAPQTQGIQSAQVIRATTTADIALVTPRALRIPPPTASLQCVLSCLPTNRQFTGKAAPVTSGLPCVVSSVYE